MPPEIIEQNEPTTAGEIVPETMEPAPSTEHEAPEPDAPEGPVDAEPAAPFDTRPPEPTPVAHVPLPAIPSRPVDEVARRVEKILEEDLSDAFGRLSPLAQQEFKLKGEQASKKIRELLRSTHLKVKKIFHLIFEWLRLLPGINHFFLEQEAKIKTDRIIQLHEAA